MPDHRNVHTESTSHFDGEKESIINDPAIDRSEKMGVTTESKQSFHRKDSMVKLTTPSDMYPFEKIMKGKKLN